MTEEELVEALADKEHEHWRFWMTLFLDRLERQPDGSLIIPAERVGVYQKLTRTFYRELQDRDKNSYLNAVSELLPIIHEYAGGIATDAINHTVDRLVQRPLDLIDQAKMASSLAILEERVNRLQTEVLADSITRYEGKDDEEGQTRQTLRGRVNELSAMAALKQVESPWND